VSCTVKLTQTHTANHRYFIHRTMDTGSCIHWITGQQNGRTSAELSTAVITFSRGRGRACIRFTTTPEQHLDPVLYNEGMSWCVLSREPFRKIPTRFTSHFHHHCFLLVLPSWIQLIRSSCPRTHRKSTRFSATTKSLHRMAQRFLRHLLASNFPLRPTSP